MSPDKPDDDLDAALRDVSGELMKALHIESLVKWTDRQIQRWPWLYQKLG